MKNDVVDEKIHRIDIGKMNDDVFVCETFQEILLG